MAAIGRRLWLVVILAFMTHSSLCGAARTRTRRGPIRPAQVATKQEKVSRDSQLISQEVLGNGTARYTFMLTPNASVAAMLTTAKPHHRPLCFLTVYEKATQPGVFVGDCDDDLPEWYWQQSSPEAVWLKAMELVSDSRYLLLEAVSEDSCKACVIDDPSQCVDNPRDMLTARGKGSKPKRVYEKVTALPRINNMVSASELPECTLEQLCDGTGTRWVSRQRCEDVGCRAGERTAQHVVDDWVWYRDDCHFRYYSREEAVERLHRRGIRKIALMGDSLTRNTAMELVSFFMGLPADPSDARASLFSVDGREFRKGIKVVVNDQTIELVYIPSWTLKKAVSTRGSFDRGHMGKGDAEATCFPHENRTGYVDDRDRHIQFGWINLEEALRQHPDIDVLILNFGIHHLLPWFGHANYQHELNALLTFLHGQANATMDTPVSTAAQIRFRGKVLYRSTSSVTPFRTRVTNNAKLEHYHRSAQQLCNRWSVPYLDVSSMSRRRPDRLYDGVIHVYPSQNPNYPHSWDSFPRLLSNEFGVLLLQALAQM